MGLSSATLLALNQLPGGVPKAYLRVLSFNQDSVLVDQRTIQLTAAALGNYETLSTGQLIVQHNGYVSVYVGNESATDVYFDNVTIEHRQGLQIQENHYDPFGLDLAGVSGAAPGLRLKNFYQFNGKENQLDLGLNWNHQDARFYDYQLGRWHVVDPLAERMRRWSPYNFSFDNPLRFMDPDGLAPGPMLTGIGIVSGLTNSIKQAIAKTSLGQVFINTTASEKALIFSHPIDAARVTLNRTNAEALQGQMMGQGIEKEPGKPALEREDNGVTNAFKHGLFSAMNTQSVGEGQAKAFGDAHEAQPDSPEAAKMDLSNNAVGRLVAKQNPAASPSGLVEQLLTQAQNGKLTVLDAHGMRNTLSLSKEQTKTIQGVIGQMKQQEQQQESAKRKTTDLMAGRLQ